MDDLLVPAVVDHDGREDASRWKPAEGRRRCYATRTASSDFAAGDGVGMGEESFVGSIG